VTELRKKVLFWKNKCEQTDKELKDVHKENEDNREDLLETIRFQEREIKMYQAITMMLLSQD
jgi:kinesin family protein 3/17